MEKRGGAYRDLAFELRGGSDASCNERARGINVRGLKGQQGKKSGGAATLWRFIAESHAGAMSAAVRQARGQGRLDTMSQCQTPILGELSGAGAFWDEGFVPEGCRFKEITPG